MTAAPAAVAAIADAAVTATATAADHEGHLTTTELWQQAAAASSC